MENVTARPVRVKREREGDTGHVIRVVSYTAECTCGWRSGFESTYGQAMHVGRMHAAEHRDDR